MAERRKQLVPIFVDWWRGGALKPLPMVGFLHVNTWWVRPERSRQGVGTGHESSNFAASHYLT